MGHMIYIRLVSFKSVNRTKLHEKNTIFDIIVKNIENDDFIKDFKFQSILNEENAIRIKRSIKTKSAITTKFLKSSIESTYREEFISFLGDSNSKALKKTIKTFKKIIESKIQNEELPKYIDVEIAPSLIQELSRISTIPASKKGTHKLYALLGIENPPLDMPNHKIEAVKMVDPKFLIFFFHIGKMRSGFTPLIKINPAFQLGYIFSEEIPFLNSSLQSQMLMDYTIGEIQSLAFIEKLIASKNSPVIHLKSFSRQNPAGYLSHEINNPKRLQLQIETLIKKINEISYYLDERIKIFLFSGVFYIEKLKDLGLETELISWFIHNWQSIPNENSPSKTRFFGILKSLNYEKACEFLKKPNRFEIYKFCQSIVQIGDILNIFELPKRSKGFPLGNPNNQMKNDGETLNKVLSCFTQKIALINKLPKNIQNLLKLKKITIFRTIELAILKESREKEEKEEKILDIYQFFILEYLKQLLIETLFQGSNERYTNFNKNLFKKQKQHPLKPSNLQIFHPNYLIGKDFLGDCWITDYLKDKSKKSLVHIFEKKRGDLQSEYLYIDELGRSCVYQDIIAQPEEHLYRISEFFKDENQKILQAVQNMLSDTWISHSLNWQQKGKYSLEFVRSAPDNKFNQMNKRKDYKKNLTQDKMISLGLLFLKDGLAVISTERAGIFAIKYLFKKAFDILHTRSQFHAFIDVMLPNQKISKLMISKSKPGEIHQDDTGKIEIYKLLPPYHFTDSGQKIARFYKNGIETEMNLTFRELYRDIIMSGNKHLRKYYTTAQKNNFLWFEGNFAIIMEYDVKAAFEQAKRLAGLRIRNIPNNPNYRFDRYKDFIHSLNNLDFNKADNYKNNLGLTKKMAQKILIAHGLRWYNEGWQATQNQIENEYIFPQAKLLWNDLNRKKKSRDHLSVISFITTFKTIYENSKMIHLLFDPNQIFEKDQPWNNKLPKFIKNNLVRKEEGFLYWNHPTSTKDSIIKLPGYLYYDIQFFSDLLNKKLYFYYWSKKQRRYILINIYNRLKLSKNFDLSLYSTQILNYIKN